MDRNTTTDGFSGWFGRCWQQLNTACGLDELGDASCKRTDAQEGIVAAVVLAVIFLAKGVHAEDSSQIDAAQGASTGTAIETRPTPQFGTASANPSAITPTTAVSEASQSASGPETSVRIDVGFLEFELTHAYGLR